MSIYQLWEKMSGIRQRDLANKSEVNLCRNEMSLLEVWYFIERNEEKCRVKSGTCYGNVAGWLAGWLSVTAGIVSKRLNLSENFLDLLVAPSFKHLGPLTPIPNSKGNPSIGGVKYTGGGKIGDFRAIFDIHRRLSQKRCEIGRWLPWNINRKSWVPDWMG